MIAENQKIKDGTPVFVVCRDDSGRWTLEDCWRASTRPDSLLWRYDPRVRKIAYKWLKRGVDGVFGDRAAAEEFLRANRAKEAEGAPRQE